MRMLVLGVGLTCMAATVSGQSRRATALENWEVLRNWTMTYGGGTSLRGGELRRDRTTNTIYARDGVRIQTATFALTAREAEIRFPQQDQQVVHLTVDLPGGVRLEITPERKATP